MNRRQSLGALAFLLAAAPLQAATLATDVRRFGARGDGRHDDSHAFQRAIDEARVVHVPEGTWMVGMLRLRSYTRLTGVGGKSLLKQAPGAHWLASVNPGDGGSAALGKNLHDIAISSLGFAGRSVEDGFAEHSHLLNINACTALTVDRCTFRAFRGDAIYVGSGNTPGAERHNAGIAIRRCHFDGVNRDNRNGVSVIDCSGLVVADSTFTRCSRPDMPGAIDIEPDPNRFHVVQDIAVTGNRIEDCGGGVAAISVILPIVDFTVAPKRILIAANRIARAHGSGITAKAYGELPESLELTIRDNHLSDTANGFVIGGVRGVAFHRNLVRGARERPLISSPRHGRASQVVIEDNVFEGIPGDALEIYPTEALLMRRNRFGRGA